MKKILLTLGSICVIVLMVMLLYSLSVYEKNYWNKTGISGGQTYNDIIKENGNPTLEKNIDDRSYMIYDGISFAFTNGFNGIFISAEITSTAYRFGRHKIGVGSTKAEVQKAYGKINPIKDLADNEFGYIDGGVWIIFRVNSDDIVEKIILSRDC